MFSSQSVDLQPKPSLPAKIVHVRLHALLVFI